MGLVVIVRGKSRLQLHALSASFVATPYDLPVDDLPDGTQVVGTAILIVEIVGVLPDIDSEEGHTATSDGRTGIRGLLDVDITSLIGREPEPARAEDLTTRLLKVRLEGIKVLVATQ